MRKTSEPLASRREASPILWFSPGWISGNKKRANLQENTNKGLVMTISHCDSVRMTAKNIRGTVGGLVLLGGLVFLTGCPESPHGGGNPISIPKVETKISVSREPFIAPPLTENGPEGTVILPYSSEGGAVPASCELGAIFKLTVTSPCACVGGICSVRVRSEPMASGDGFFTFRFATKNGVWSNLGQANVKILEVGLFIVSGDRQTGVVGEKLPEPIVVSLKNSAGVPIPRVKIFWSVKEKEGDRGEDKNGKPDEERVVQGRSGRLSSCTEETDDKGQAKCEWTLGTRQPAGVIYQEVDVSAFYKYENKQDDKAKVRTFSTTVNPGPATKLSFSNQDYILDTTESSGPHTSTEPDEDTQKLGEPLGGEKGIWVFAQDKYGNRALVGDRLVVTLSLRQKPVEGAFLVEEGVKEKVSGFMSNSDFKLGDGKDEDEAGAIEWKQGFATFKKLKVTKAGIYDFDASAPGLEGAKFLPFLVQK